MVEALNDLLVRLSAALEHERAFIADAAHELRTPLTALDLQLQALGSATGDEERGRAYSDLRAGVTRATRLVGQLLTLARHERRAGWAPGPVELGALARGVVTDLVVLADARRIDLGVTAPETATVSGDEGSLSMLLRNLVDNAIRHTPTGGRVDVAVRRGGDGTGAVIQVTDEGPGIPEVERSRVMDRFYRVPGSGGSGAGIGLAIVRAIAEQHGATVELGAGPGDRGLSVRVVFPSSPTV